MSTSDRSPRADLVREALRLRRPCRRHRRRPRRAPPSPTTRRAARLRPRRSRAPPATSTCGSGTTPTAFLPRRHDATVRAHWSAHARRTAGGVAQVRRLDEGTGCSRSRRSCRRGRTPRRTSSPPSGCCTAERLVIDVRRGWAAARSIVALVVEPPRRAAAGRGPGPVGRDGSREAFRTDPVGGRPRRGSRSSVLVLLEDDSPGLARSCPVRPQAVGRAIVVGETTGRGRPSAARLRPHRRPAGARAGRARSGHAVTGGHGRAIGVAPDVPLSATMHSRSRCALFGGSTIWTAAGYLGMSGLARNHPGMSTPT